MPGPVITDWILWDIVEEHFDEAAFLLGQWERALRSPKYNLKELGVVERRLEAHLDGLVAGGAEVAARVLDPELANVDEPARATVAALALLFTSEEASIRRVVDMALSAEGPLAQALSRALVLASAGPLDRMLLAGFRGAVGEPQKAALLDILTCRGVDVGDLLHPCSESGNPHLIGAAINAAGRFGRRELLAFTEEHLTSAPHLSALAIKASLALRSSKGWRRCLELAHEPAGDPYPSLLLVALLGQPADHDVLFMQLKNPARVERTLWVLGFCGTLQAANACLDHLGSKDARVSKAAAEAIAWIGGLDLKDRRFRASAAEPAPDETLPPLDEDDLDADLGLDGVDDLPVPNPAEIARWWKERRGTITANERYLLGRPSSVGAIVHALDSGSLWRRHAVAVELAIRSGGEQHVSTDAFSSRQRRQIAALVGMSAGQWSQVGV